MRFGYALAAKEVIDQKLAGSLLPWNVGTVPMWRPLAAFEDTEDSLNASASTTAKWISSPNR